MLGALGRKTTDRRTDVVERRASAMEKRHATDVCLVLSIILRPITDRKAEKIDVGLTLRAVPAHEGEKPDGARHADGDRNEHRGIPVELVEEGYLLNKSGHAGRCCLEFELEARDVGCKAGEGVDVEEVEERENRAGWKDGRERTDGWNGSVSGLTFARQRWNRC